MTTREDIKNWLKGTGKDRAWLGETIGVSKRTVDNWLSGADPIPAAKKKLIEERMQNSAAPDQTAAVVLPLDTSSVNYITILLTQEEYAECVSAATAEHLDLQTWARKLLLDYCRAHPAKEETGTS